MRELVAVPPGNISLVPIGNELVAAVEVIVVTSEPEYIAVDDDVVRKRNLMTYRFSSSIDGLRGLVKVCEEAIERAEKLAEQFKREAGP